MLGSCKYTSASLLDAILVFGVVRCSVYMRHLVVFIFRSFCEFLVRLAHTRRE
jgi:hypothetical protein